MISIILTLIQNKPHPGSTSNAIQLIQVRDSHWIAAAFMSTGSTVNMYDSAYSTLDEGGYQTVVNFHCSLNDVCLTTIQKQSNSTNYGYLQWQLKHQSLLVKTQVQEPTKKIACASTSQNVFNNCQLILFRRIIITSR